MLTNIFEFVFYIKSILFYIKLQAGQKKCIVRIIGKRETQFIFHPYCQTITEPNETVLKSEGGRERVRERERGRNMYG